MRQSVVAVTIGSNRESVDVVHCDLSASGQI
jgi:hypothetical protein